MKLGLVRRGYSASGGAEAYVRRFANSATDAGHQCVLFAGPEWPTADANVWPYERVQVPGDNPKAFADGLRKLDPKRHCDCLLSLERVWECDVYRAGDGVHADWLDQRAKYEPFWKTWTRGFNSKHEAILALESSLFVERKAGRVIANSQMVKTAITKRYQYPSDRIKVVYNGVPARTIHPEDRAAARDELGASDADYVLLFVGSGWERKGLKFAIQALRKTPGAKLWVAGRGSPGTMPSCTRAQFLGPRSDVGRLLAGADAFILPTLYEPFSNACLEAAAAGLPVITTSHNGFAEIIDSGGEGSIIEEPSDISALSDAIKYWSDPGRRADAKPRLTALGAKFTMERNLAETLALIA